MKKLIAAALTGALVLGTVGTSVVFAADDDKTITVAASATPMQKSLRRQNHFLRKKDMTLRLLYLMIMYCQTKL